MTEEEKVDYRITFDGHDVESVTIVDSEGNNDDGSSSVLTVFAEQKLDRHKQKYRETTELKYNIDLRGFIGCSIVDIESGSNRLIYSKLIPRSKIRSIIINDPKYT